MSNTDNEWNKAAEEVYNSYLLLYKLNELKVDDGKSLQEVISEAISNKETQVKFNIGGKQSQITITLKDNKYKLKVLGEHTKPEVKDVLGYTDEEIIALWANSEVSIEKDQNNNTAFCIDLLNQVGSQYFKVGGLGKKVPFGIRFSNFYKVIEILKDETKPLKERLRLANSIATGSGKTGDIALLKFWAYLANIPCITIVPSDTLKAQSNKFDKEFLPDEVANTFAEPLCKKEADCKAGGSANEFKYKYEYNTKHVTTTFKEALDTHWNKLNDTYGKNHNEPALICIDEAPKLKENAVLMARAIEISHNNPVAIFSATPDHFLSDELKIEKQILLSPKEREALGIGKLPVVNYHKMEFKTLDEMMNAECKGKTKYDLLFSSPEIAYVEKNENTHKKLYGWENAVKSFKKATQNQKLKTNDYSQLFLDLISKSFDSQAYKAGLIATEDRWAEEVKNYITKGKEERAKKRKQVHIESLVNAVKELNLGLKDKDIKSLVEQNLNVEIGGQLLPSIKLHNIIDTLNEYKKSSKEVTKDGIKQFIKDKYDIIDSDKLKFNSELTNAILKLHEHKGYPEYQKSIERNYPGDKKLHKHIFTTFPKIKEFCEQHTVISYFNGETNYAYVNTQGHHCNNKYSDNNNQNMLNMIKAGFVPNIISKELAIGIDAPRLQRVAAIIKDKTDILDPMFLLQLIGRVGRDANRKGICYFDMFTSDESYLKLEDIPELSGQALLTRLEDSYQKQRCLSRMRISMFT